jgi:hypothetical protein
MAKTKDGGDDEKEVPLEGIEVALKDLRIPEI